MKNPFKRQYTGYSLTRKNLELDGMFSNPKNERRKKESIVGKGFFSQQEKKTWNLLELVSAYKNMRKINKTKHK